MFVTVIVIFTLLDRDTQKTIIYFVYRDEFFI